MWLNSEKAKLVATCMGALVLFSSAAHADRVIRLGHDNNEVSSMQVIAERFAESVSEMSNGQITVQIQCCGTLGSGTEMLQKQQVGALDISMVAHPNMAAVFPLLDVITLPYIFESHDHVATALDGRPGEILKEESEKQLGLTILEFFEFAARNVMNTRRAVNSIEDLDGLLLRVPGNPVMLEMFEGFGASPVPMAWSETLTAVQTGTIDGLENPTYYLWSARFSEIAKHVAVTEHMYFVGIMVASSNLMNSLTEEDREIIQRAARSAAEWGRSYSEDQVADVVRKMEDQGVVFTYPDKSPFIAVAERIQNDFLQGKDENYQALFNSISELR